MRKSSNSTQRSTANSTKSDDEVMPKWAMTMKDDIIDTLTIELNNMVIATSKQMSDEININLKKTVAAAVKKATAEITQTITQQQLEIAILRIKHQKTHDRILKMECHSMKENLIFTGIVEKDQETEGDIRLALEELFHEMELDPANIRINSCHRMPSFGRKKTTRDVIARFDNTSTKLRVLKAGYKLKNRDIPIYISHQFPKEIVEKRNILRPIMKKAKELKMKCTLVEDKLIIEGKAYYVDTLQTLPFDIADISTKMTDQYVFYAGKLSPYSNFYTMGHPFKLDGTTYNSVEQYYQYTKATLAGDVPAAMNIMTESDPLTMKRVGDAVKASTKIWNNNRAKAEMTRAVTAKFIQNPDLKLESRQQGHVYLQSVTDLTTSGASAYHSQIHMLVTNRVGRGRIGWGLY